jgi:hypothetical protein
MATKKLNTDQKTLDLIKDVQARKKDIAKALGKPAYTTNMSFTYFEGHRNEAINLHTISNVKALVGVVAFLREKERGYVEAGEILGVEGLPPFTWDGFSVAEWIEDIRIRLAKVQVTAKQKKLEALEARLNANISPELKAQMELDAIADELG